MPARQDNHYSVAAQTTDVRKVVFELIIITVVLAVVLNLLSDAIFATFDYRNIAIIWRWAAAAGLVMAGGGATYWFWKRNDSIFTEQTRIDLLIPYELNREEGLSVPAPLKALYSVIVDAKKFFTGAYSRKKRKELEQVFRAGQPEPDSWQFKEWTSVLHHDLVDALLLYTLDFYSERALGDLSRVAWIRSEMVSVKRPLAWFPEQLQQNVFIKARSGWKIQLPEAVTIHISETADSRLWDIRHRHYGSVFLELEKPISVHAWEHHSKKIRSLRINMDEPHPESMYLALGSRIRVWAEIQGVLSRKRDLADCYCTWATQFQSIFEQALDWSYFDEVRRPGQLQIWTSGNVEALQEQVAGIEVQLIEMQEQLEEVWIHSKTERP